MKTKDLVLMAMFVALHAVLEYLKVAFNFFSMPQGEASVWLLFLCY